jgi:hypothetical protein
MQVPELLQLEKKWLGRQKKFKKKDRTIEESRVK